MKRWVLLLVITVSYSTAFAKVPAADTSLNFTHPMSRSVNHWVVLPKQASSTEQYPFGFLYIDPVDGFVFNLEGFFNTNGNGRFVRVKRKIDEKTHSAYMLKPGVKPLVSIIDQDHFEELDIYPRPDWLDQYISYTDTTAHDIEWAKAYNKIGDPGMAAGMLEDVYKVNPHLDDMEIELSTAYVALQRYDEAIAVLTSAIKNNPKPEFYKQLGNAYLAKGAFAKVLETCKAGIELCHEGDNAEKSQMALYIALAYRAQSDKNGYQQWIQYAKAWAPKHSEIADALSQM